MKRHTVQHYFVDYELQNLLIKKKLKCIHRLFYMQQSDLYSEQPACEMESESHSANETFLPQKSSYLPGKQSFLWSSWRQCLQGTLFLFSWRKIVHSVNLQIHHSHVQACGNMARPGVINFPSGQGGSTFFLSRVLLVLAKMQFRIKHLSDQTKSSVDWRQSNSNKLKM